MRPQEEEAGRSSEESVVLFAEVGGAGSTAQELDFRQTELKTPVRDVEGSSLFGATSDRPEN